ncbi:MAG: hypothetical protein ACR2LV_03230 [Solirubrobacteraceae bacterium]
MSFVVTAGRRAATLGSRCPTALLACACGLAALLSCCVAALAPAIARADHTQESIFQDDQYLIYSGPAIADHTLAQLHSLGVQRIRVNVKWSTLAPDSASVTRPADFDATNPADYPAGGWTRYDEVLVLAEMHGIGVEFNITDPGPLWAMGQDSPTARAADHWKPSAVEFGQFMQALGTRYSGSYGPLPRVHDWSIWNEPNQPGWLAPQSLSHRGPQSPRLYRQYVDSAYRGLSASGHLGGRDTILIGELAPVGFSTPGFYTAIEPMPFLRSLYCVDSRYRPLTGSSASALGCPTRGPRRAFVARNPGLFSATGFAQHPYDFLLAPGKSAPQPSFVPIANLSRLEQGLDRAFGAYGVHRQIPLYLTEYGYQTNPPDPYQIVTPAQQAAYINQADYMAWRDPRVHSMAQFLLYDALPDPRFTPQEFGYWDTFQTGLLYADGKPKPAYDAYRMPIWIPSPRIHRGGRMFIWGQLRGAAHNVTQRADIQWRPAGGAFRTIAVVSTRNRVDFLTSTVRLRASGEVRIAWRSPSSGVLTSRSVAVRVG